MVPGNEGGLDRFEWNEEGDGGARAQPVEAPRYQRMQWREAPAPPRAPGAMVKPALAGREVPVPATATRESLEMNIREVFGLPEVKGAVGVEVEIEGMNLPALIGNGHQWHVEHDGSLRGEAYEYVFRGPVDKVKAFGRLDSLALSFKKHGSDIFDTGRAGVHVHVNVQDMSIKQVGCFITLYYIFENILLDYCGEDRVGNLFCLRTCDAEGAIPLITQAFNNHKLRGLGTDDIRYAALNLNSLPKYGSVEFRPMRSTGDMQLIKNWIDILLTMKEYSLRFNDPRDIVESMSGMSTAVMFLEVFGEHTGLVYDDDSMYEGVCYAQDFAYGVHWDRPNPDVQAIIDGYMLAEGDF